jgi:prophage regulatory protein
MSATQRPMRFTARITVEIEDFDQVSKAFWESLSQTFKSAVFPPLVPAPPLRPSTATYEPMRSKPTPVRQEIAKEPLLLDTKQVAKLLNIGERTLWRYWNSGRVPKPIKIGGAVRWQAAELREWIDAGCPTTEVWMKSLGRPN